MSYEAIIIKLNKIKKKKKNYELTPILYSNKKIYIKYNII